MNSCSEVHDQQKPTASSNNNNNNNNNTANSTSSHNERGIPTPYSKSLQEPPDGLQLFWLSLAPLTIRAMMSLPKTAPA
jgi:hypothetical protein